MRNIYPAPAVIHCINIGSRVRKFPEKTVILFDDICFYHIDNKSIEWQNM